MEGSQAGDIKTFEEAYAALLEIQEQLLALQARVASLESLEEPGRIRAVTLPDP